MDKMDDEMNEQEWLAKRFEANRTHLRAVAYRMLGSLSETDDAVQEAWLHVSRSDTGSIENIGGWLTRVVARVCLDMLRSRKLRREASLEALEASLPHATKVITNGKETFDPEYEALLADSVGLALLVVLETLTPAERLAFVLHDMFAVPYDEIAPIVGRSSTAARQLASRARRRVRGQERRAATVAGADAEADVALQREVVEAFLSASRGGDFEALLVVLDPDVVARADASAAPKGAPREARGVQAVARQALAFSGQAQLAQPALVNGAVGLIVAPRGRLISVLAFTIRHGKIAEIDVIADPAQLRRLKLRLLND